MMNPFEKKSKLAGLTGPIFSSLLLHAALVGIAVAAWLLPSKPKKVKQTPIVTLIKVKTPKSIEKKETQPVEVKKEPEPPKETKEAPKKKEPSKKPEVKKEKPVVKKTQDKPKPKKNVEKKPEKKKVEETKEPVDNFDFDLPEERSDIVASNAQSRYQNIINSIIGRLWKVNLPSSLDIETGDYCIFSFDILQDGSIVNVALKRSSGNSQMDGIARKVLSIAKLPSIPEEMNRTVFKVSSWRFEKE